MVRSTISLSTDSTLAVSVYHHSYPWLETNNGVAFRNHIESTSDIVLCGHQHYDHGFDKATLAGERIFYSEGDVLQEGGEPGRSGFRVLVLEPQARQRRVVAFAWTGSSYSRTGDSDWTSYTRTAHFADRLTPTPEFLAKLTDSGIGLKHQDSGPVPLQDFFVYPDAQARSLLEPTNHKDISGESLLRFFIQYDGVMVQGSAKAGKTSLAKVLCYNFLSVYDLCPLLIEGARVKGADRRSFEHLVNSETVLAYGPRAQERFQLLAPAQRALIIDNWDECPLAPAERDTFLKAATSHFVKVIVFVDNAMFMQQILAQLNHSEASLPNYLTLKEMSHVGRGALIDRWLSYECQHGSPEYYRRVEETESLIKTVLGRNTLPSLPFIVIAILEASRRKVEIIPEQGSFGYLYELLITTALSTTKSAQPQLDKKYEILPALAYHLFITGADVIRASDLDQLLDRYAKTVKVKINKKDLIGDLKLSQVLYEEEGNYLFAYDHYYQYFLALYFKNNIKGNQGAELRQTLSSLGARLPADFNSRFLMFFIYLTRDDQLISELIRHANVILAEQSPATFSTDVDFYNLMAPQCLPDLPEAIDLEASRKKRRQAADAAPKRDLSTPESVGYSDELSIDVKIKFAIAYTEVLGQVVRNFTSSLPGDTKVEILTTTYRLGLRLLSAALGFLSTMTASVRQEEAQATQTKDRTNYVRLVGRFLETFSPIVGFGIIKRISQCVGSAEIDESAYEEALAEVGATDATELIDMAISLDHSSGRAKDAASAPRRWTKAGGLPKSCSTLPGMACWEIRIRRLAFRRRGVAGRVLREPSAGPHLGGRCLRGPRNWRMGVAHIG